MVRQTKKSFSPCTLYTKLWPCRQYCSHRCSAVIIETILRVPSLGHFLSSDFMADCDFLPWTQKRSDEKSPKWPLLSVTDWLVTGTLSLSGRGEGGDSDCLYWLWRALSSAPPCHTGSQGRGGRLQLLHQQRRDGDLGLQPPGGTQRYQRQGETLSEGEQDGT